MEILKLNEFFGKKEAEYYKANQYKAMLRNSLTDYVSDDIASKILTDMDAYLNKMIEVAKYEGAKQQTIKLTRPGEKARLKVRLSELENEYSKHLNIIK